MCFDRAGFGTVSSIPADTGLNTLITIAQRFGALTVLLMIVSFVMAAQSPNINITEFPVPGASIPHLAGITVGSDGALWFTENDSNQIGRITTAGLITMYPLPPYVAGAAVCAPPNSCGPSSITAGSDGALWFVGYREIGRISTSGVATKYPTVGAAGAITAGPDGALWFTDGPSNVGGSIAIGRITTTGVITEYQLPSGVGGSIISGSDGALWFEDFRNKAIGRITATGGIREYPVPNFTASYDDDFNLTVGPDGAIWFGEGTGFIGRITTSGTVTDYPIGANVVVNGLTKGPDGAVWFTTIGAGTPRLGRITMDGLVTLYDAPSTTNGQIVLGPDGALWYSELGGTNIARVQIPARTGVLSHIAAGGGWTTAITLVNTASTEVPVTVALHKDDGSALSLPLTTTQQGSSQTNTATSVNATVKPHSTLLISAGDQAGSSTVTGWADVTSTGPVGGFAIFRANPQGGSPSEGTVPLQSQFPSTITLSYDNTAGFVTGVALANLSTASTNITATIWDDNGTQLGTQNITVAGNGHTALVLPNQVPLTSGKRGIVQFQSTANGGLSGIGLRFSPFGTFTSVPTT